MRAILLIVAILALLFGIGWVTFAADDGSASVTIDTDKVKDDTSTVVEKSKEIVEDGLEKLKSKTTDDGTPAKEVEELQLKPGSAANP